MKSKPEPEKEDGSREALSVAGGSSHEAELEKGHIKRASPPDSGHTSSENSGLEVVQS